MDKAKLKVLLIDSISEDFQLVKRLLETFPDNSYEVNQVKDSKDITETLQKNKIDVCLINFQDEQNINLKECIKNANLKETLPIIYLTEDGESSNNESNIYPEACDTLNKRDLTALSLKYSIHYSIKHATALERLNEIKAQVLQQDRLSSIGLLASSLAHEIGTPLAVIRGRAELTNQAVDIEFVKNNMNTIVSQIDRITKVINSLLNLSRATPPKYIISASLNAVIDDVVKLIEQNLNQNNIKFNVEIKKELKVKAEYGLLGQVILNILTNSFHAIEEEKSNGRKDNHKISLIIESDAEKIIITIKDTGCGIPKENLNQIYKPFFTTKEIGLGTGLGLATAYKLIHQWGGSITLQSELGKGTTFSINLIRL